MNKKVISIILISIIVLIVVVYASLRLLGIWWVEKQENLDSSQEIAQQNSNLPFGQSFICYENCKFIIEPTVNGEVKLEAVKRNSNGELETIGTISLNVIKGVRQEGTINGVGCEGMSIWQGDNIISSTSCFAKEFG